MTARLTAVAAQKGGATKTAVAVNIGPMLAAAGRRVLVVDLDQQADLTRRFGHTQDSLEFSVVDVLAPRESVSVERAIVQEVRGVEGLDLLASDLRAAGLEDQLSGQKYRESKLRKALEPVMGSYDEIILDCPPSLGTLTMNGLVAADRAIVPVNMQDEAAIAGMEQLLDTLNEIQEQEADPVRLLSVVRNRAKPASRAYRANSRALEPFVELGLPFAKTELKEAAAWHNAAAEGLPLVLALPNSEAARNFRQLMVELWPDVEFPEMSEVAPVWRRRLLAGVA